MGDLARDKALQPGGGLRWLELCVPQTRDGVEPFQTVILGAY